MNSYDFSGKVAAITGGANGIGAAVAERLARSGAKVVIWDMDTSAPDAKIANLAKDDCLLVQVDVSDSTSVAAALAATEASFGKVDVLINSAGIAGPHEHLGRLPRRHVAQGTAGQSGWDVPVL